MGNDCFRSKAQNPNKNDDLTLKKIVSTQYLNQKHQQHAANQENSKSGLRSQQIRLSVSSKQSLISPAIDTQSLMLYNKKEYEIPKKQQLQNMTSTNQAKNFNNLQPIQENHSQSVEIEQSIKIKSFNRINSNNLQKHNQLYAASKSKVEEDKIEIAMSDEEQQKQEKQNENENEDENDDDDDDIFKAAGVGRSADSKIIKWSGIIKTQQSQIKSRPNKSQDFLRNSQLQLKQQDFTQEQGNQALEQQDSLQGVIIQQDHFSTIKVYNSKIMFQAMLPKRQAGPIIVPFLDYSQYCI